ncbi:MAG: NADH-quinone oxidoreductase subunit NuoN [Rickettsiales bacterium]|nr:NADH-quinone oxidoreductase subunit NuoN [Rickettsiales bacterium]
MFDVAELVPLSPELLLLAVAIIVLMAGAFRGNQVTLMATLFSVLALAAAAYLITVQPKDQVIVFEGLFRSDYFTQYSKILMLVGALMALLISMLWLREEENKRFEYPVLLLLATTGMMLMVSADDLLSLYMGLELGSLALYVMTAIDRDNTRSSEAGLKYFILGSLASGMMLFGASLVYGFSGTTNFASLAHFFSAYVDQPVSYGLIVGLVMVIVGFCFKVSAVPFHMWTPDVYEGAPTPVVTFFAVVPKIAALCVFGRFLLQPFHMLFEHWQQILIFVSIASMIIGAFGALRQTNIKRLLAYSSIGHVGYALIGIAVGAESGIKAMLIYLSLYLFMSLGAFGFVCLMKRNGKNVEQIEDLGGLSKTSPKLALFMALMMFSMAGIPPLAGFFGKMYVFLSAIEAELYSLVIIGLLSSVVAAYYYLKVVKVMYFDEQKDTFDRFESFGVRFVLCVCAIITVGFFLMPTPLVKIAGEAAKALIL